MLCAGHSAFSMTGDAHEPFTELYSLALCCIINHSNNMKHNSCLYISVRNDLRLFLSISMNTPFSTAPENQWRWKNAVDYVLQKKVFQSIIPDSTFVTCLIVQMFTQFSTAGIDNALTKYLNFRKTLIHVPPLREAFKSFVTQNHQGPHVRNTITEQSACLERCFLGFGE